MGHWVTRFLHRCRSLAALLAPCQVRFIPCRSSLNDVRHVFCSRPLVLLPDSGIQVMATPAGLTSGNRSMWPANLSLQVCNLGPISYHFLDKWRFLVSRVLNTPSDLGRRKWIYIAPLLKYLTLKALRYGSHSVTCKLHHTCL